MERHLSSLSVTARFYKHSQYIDAPSEIQDHPPHKVHHTKKTCYAAAERDRSAKGSEQPAGCMEFCLSFRRRKPSWCLINWYMFRNKTFIFHNNIYQLINTSPIFQNLRLSDTIRHNLKLSDTIRPVLWISQSLKNIWERTNIKTLTN
jgi:hypothetical protein